MISSNRVKYFLFTLVLFFITPVLLHAEKITNFDANMTLSTSGDLRVIETITYDFEDQYRHGIFRVIPETFKPGGALGENKIKLREVTNGGGISHQYKDESSRGEFRIRIGNPDETITGEHIYQITYDVKNSIGFFEDFDELYWNVIGGQWEVPIENMTATIDLPEGINLKAISHYCGNFGERNGCGGFTEYPERLEFVLAKKPVNPGEFVTFDIEFEKGLIAAPTELQKNLQYLKDFWFIPLPFFILWRFLPKRYREYKKYKYFKRTHPIGVEYDPGDITLYEASYFHDAKFELSNLGALAVWFAVHGFLKIKEVGKKTYSFTVIADEQKLSTLSNKKQEILKLLEDVSPVGNARVKGGNEGLGWIDRINKNLEKAAQKKKLYEMNIALMKEVEDALIDKGYIEMKTNSKYLSSRNVKFSGILSKSSLQNSRFSGLFIYFFFAVNPGVFIFIFSYWLMNSPALGVIFSGTMILLGIMNFILPKRPRFTQEGLMAERYVAGLYKYIDMAEKDRMNVLNQLSATPELYEKLLPFAMIFGLEKKWSKTFEGVLNHNPEWFDSDINTSFSPALFGSSMHSLGSAIGNSGAPSSSSGGGSGGSSGGGGGGGGGGSW